MKAFIFVNASEFTYSSSVYLYYMFPGKFLSKFLVISKIFWCSDFFVSGGQKTDYLIPSPNIFLILPQFFHYDLVSPNQLLLLAYSLLIFLCPGCLSQQLKISGKYSTIKRWFSTKLRQVRNDSVDLSINDF